MKTVAPAVLALLATRQFWSANLFTFTLYDGTVLRYTDADKDISSGGHTFLCGGPSQTGGPFFTGGNNGSGNKVKAHWKVGVDVDTITFDVIPGAALVESVAFLTACRLGFFDQATIQIDRAVMPTAYDASAGTIPIFLGYVADVDISRSIATFTVSGGTVLLNRPFPFSVYQPGCLNTLYDTNCTLSRTSFQATGAATSGTTANIINDTTLAGATGTYDFGMIKFTSGQNNNFIRGIQTYVHGSPNIITLMSPFPFTPAIADSFVIYRGCNKVLSDATRGCTSFSNTANFRGFPFIPAPSTAA